MSKQVLTIAAIAMIAVGFFFLLTAFASEIPSLNPPADEEQDWIPENEGGSTEGDFDGDGKLTEADRAYLIENYNHYDTPYDLNQDNIVDIYDVTYWEYLRMLQETGGGSSGGDSDGGGGGAIGGAHPLSILPFGGDWIVGIGLIGVGVFLLMWRR